jgi:formamidopyrimidine-DNA glycosylase
MPELPDVTVYVERLRALTIGQPLEAIRIASPFVLRTVSPSPGELRGLVVESIERIGKRIAIGVAGERFIVIHLMIAGRLRWKPRGEKLPAKIGLAAFDFPHGTLVFTEASPKKRASIHLVAGRAQLAAFDRGGLDVFSATTQAFGERLRSERHTVKRALTDPTLFDGIGNAYSDEILHAARLSPFRMTSALPRAASPPTPPAEPAGPPPPIASRAAITDDEIAVLHRACVAMLTRWTQRLRDDVGDGFPDKVTAFLSDMAVHGKYGQPCPVCGTKVQRIVYAENEANYCPTCQTEGRLLADRSLSRLLKADWPRSLEELEDRKAQRIGPAPAPAPAAAGAPAVASGPGLATAAAAGPPARSALRRPRAGQAKPQR